MHFATTTLSFPRPKPLIIFWTSIAAVQQTLDEVSRAHILCYPTVICTQSSDLSDLDCGEGENT